MNSTPFTNWMFSLYCAVREEAPVGGSHNLRSSGKKPLNAEEADRYEALARKRRSSRVKSSIPEPIVISDDEGEDQAELECPSGFPDPASIGGYGWKPPVNLDGPLPRVRPLAMIDPDQGSTDPDPSTATGVLQYLENALKQVISILSVRWGYYANLHPVLVDCLREIRRVGGVRLAMRCDRKLVYWQSLALRTEALAFFELHNEVVRLKSEARLQIRREQATRARLIKEQEEAATVLREWQDRVQRMMDTYTPTASQKGPTLENLRRESVEVRRAYLEIMQNLDELHHQEEISVAAFSDDEGLERAAKAQARANRAREIVNLAAALESFTVLDCAE